MKKYTTLIIVLLSFLISNNAKSEEVVISGQDTAYAGQEIVLLRYTDWITEVEEEITRATVGEDGSFELRFNTDRTLFVFAYLGIFKAHLYAEPGHSYQVVLPQRIDKEVKDRLNPYFNYTVIHLGTENYDENELNTMIRMFNDTYQPYYNKHVVDVYKLDDFKDLDKDIEKMDKPFKGVENVYFNNYRKYKFALLRHLAYQEKTKSISDNYFLKEPVAYHHIAYMDLFTLVYGKYFEYYSRSTEGKTLPENIENQGLSALKKTLAKDKTIGNKDGALLELVILKGLYDEFYDDTYSRESLLSLLDKLIESSSDNGINIIGNNIKSEVTKLMVGYSPPNFILYDPDSNKVSLENFKGKYVYLNFCSCFSYSCLKEFSILSTLYEKHKERLEILTIIVDPDDTKMREFLKKSKLEWKFVHYGNQSDIIRNYDIRAFPIYYLIGPDGKLLLSPAPTPDENFEGRLFKVMRSKGDI